MDRGGIIYWPEGAAATRLSAMKLLDTRSAGGTPTLRESIAWSVAWVVLALLFGLVVTLRLGSALGAQFFTAYVVEKALSVDNLFVLMLLLGRLRIPANRQRTVLMSGVVGAIVLRAVFLVAGTAAVARFHFAGCVLGALLVVMAAKLLRGGKDDGPGAGAGAAAPPREGFAVRLLRRVAPFAGPTVVALIAVEATDLVFAFDSIPAVLGVTSSPFVAVTSNALAVLGLRSLYFVVAGALSRLKHLDTGLGLVLVFVGLKMVAAPWVDVPAAASLAVVACILGGATLASLRASPSTEEKEV
jgi:tellurite resistance protein TerC